MTVATIVEQLEALGQASIKKVLLKHDIKEPFFGVKIEELKKIRKQIKSDHELALKLYDTGIYDARYLAGLIAEPQKMSGEELQKWAEDANAPALREYTVAWVASESKYGMTKANEWINSGNEDLASIGWATLASIVSITEDSDLDIPILTKLVKEVGKTIHSSPNRVKQVMNGFVISVGIYVKELNELAKQTAREMNVVTVDMGDTACKVPFAIDYIAKAEAKNIIGKKKKSARCM